MKHPEPEKKDDIGNLGSKIWEDKRSVYDWFFFSVLLVFSIWAIFQLFGESSWLHGFSLIIFFGFSVFFCALFIRTKTLSVFSSGIWITPMAEPMVEKIRGFQVFIPWGKIDSLKICERTNEVEIFLLVDVERRELEAPLTDGRGFVRALEKMGKTGLILDSHRYRQIIQEVRSAP